MLNKKAINASWMQKEYCKYLLKIDPQISMDFVFTIYLTFLPQKGLNKLGEWPVEKSTWKINYKREGIIVPLDRGPAS